MEVRLLRGLVGLRAHLDDDEVCWNRIGNAELVPEGCEMMVDRHPQASIYSHRPIGLGRDESKGKFRLTCLASGHDTHKVVAHDPVFKSSVPNYRDFHLRQ